MVSCQADASRSHRVLQLFLSTILSLELCVVAAWYIYCCQDRYWLNKQQALFDVRMNGWY
jgi:hypothetical protein